VSRSLSSQIAEDPGLLYAPETEFSDMPYVKFFVFGSLIQIRFQWMFASSLLDERLR